MELYKDGITVEVEGIEADKFRAAGYVEVIATVKEPEEVKEPKAKAK